MHPKPALPGVLLRQIAEFLDDLVDVLQHLEPLERIGVIEPHAGTDELQDIHDAERIVALMRAKLAVVGVIDRDERIDPRGLGRIELAFLQLAPIGR